MYHVKDDLIEFMVCKCGFRSYNFPEFIPKIDVKYGTIYDELAMSSWCAACGTIITHQFHEMGYIFQVYSKPGYPLLRYMLYLLNIRLGDIVELYNRPLDIYSKKILQIKEKRLKTVLKRYFEVRNEI